jgi:hypothetical protein
LTNNSHGPSIHECPIPAEIFQQDYIDSALTNLMETAVLEEWRQYQNASPLFDIDSE